MHAVQTKRQTALSVIQQQINFTPVCHLLMRSLWSSPLYCAVEFAKWSYIPPEFAFSPEKIPKFAVNATESCRPCRNAGSWPIGPTPYKKNDARWDWFKVIVRVAVWPIPPWLRDKSVEFMPALKTTNVLDAIIFVFYNQPRSSYKQNKQGSHSKKLVKSIGLLKSSVGRVWCLKWGHLRAKKALVSQWADFVRSPAFFSETRLTQPWKQTCQSYQSKTSQQAALAFARWFTSGKYIWAFKKKSGLSAFW